MFELIFLVLGLLVLVLGANLVIKGSTNIAQHYKISPLFLGLTLLTLGTNLPELVVSITASMRSLGGVDTSGLILGNVIGSGFGQIGFTLGILGLFTFLFLTKRELLRDGSMMIGSVLLLFLVAFDGVITMVDGLIFIFVYLIYFMSLSREEKIKEKMKKAPTMHLFWDLMSLVAGFILIIYSSGFVVDHALVLVKLWGVKQSLVGILIIGFGTSLPELAVSISALLKKSIGLGVGNLIGSNIFDILVVLGISGIISDIKLSSMSLIRFDIPALFILSVIVVLFFVRKYKVVRKEAMVILGLYFVYVGFKLFGF